MTRLRISLGMFAVAFLSLGLLACGGDDNGNANATATSEAQGGGAAATPSTGGTIVNATEDEYSILLDKTSVAAGTVTFQIKNEGTMTHEFIVLQTDLAVDQLPQQEGAVNEDAAGITVAGEVEDIETGKTATLKLDLAPGKYVVICNISGHYQLGMRAALTVGSATPGP